MPTGIRIDWSIYDSAIQELSHMTTAEWRKTYAPHVSDSAINKRAKKLGIKPKEYKPTAEHKAKISKALISYEDDLVQKIISMRQTHSRREICDILNVDDTTFWRIINRHDIKLTDEGRTRALVQQRTCGVGKIPWNLGQELTKETKEKISKSLMGESNGQYGKPLTKQQIQKRSETYKRTGYAKFKQWLTSDSAKIVFENARQRARTPEARKKSSLITSDLMRRGILKHRGIGSHLETIKGGKIYTKSTYETKYVDILEEDYDVAKYEYEPLRISYKDELGHEKYYVPDFLVTYKDGTRELVEIKPEKLMSLPKNQLKFIAAAEYSKLHGYNFKIVTECDLKLK